MKTRFSIVFILSIVACAVLASPPAKPGDNNHDPGSGGSGNDHGNQSDQGGASTTWTADTFLASSPVTGGCIIREGVWTGYSNLTAVASSTSSAITGIVAGVCADCTTLKTVDLSKSVITEIPDSAFAYCTSLTSVALPASCTNIGANAFIGCTKLSSISGTGVAAVGADAFHGCTALTSVIGTTLGDYAYAQSGLTSVSASGLTLGEGAFAGCTNLTSVSNLPTTVPAATFSGCTALATTNYSGVATFGQAAFAGIAAGTLEFADSASLGDYAFAADEATVDVVLVNTNITYGSDAFLGRTLCCTVAGTSDAVILEASSLAAWLVENAGSTDVTAPTNSTGSVSYSTAALEAWLADPANASAIEAYCYATQIAAAKDEDEEFSALSVDGTTFTYYAQDASTASAVTVTPTASYDLSTGDEDFSSENITIGEADDTGACTVTPSDTDADKCFMRLEFSKGW